jgi:ankyrin repeat protein
MTGSKLSIFSHNGKITGYWIITRSNTDIVEILMKHNVDINQRGDLHNQTPIYCACRNGHTDIV